MKMPRGYLPMIAGEPASTTAESYDLRSGVDGKYLNSWTIRAEGCAMGGKRPR
jgi:hypothetical protein